MKKIIVIISLMTLVFAQAEWNGLSVANSDDLNALSANPAGLGIHRIYQSGFFIENDDFFKFDENTLYKSIDRYDGFAYALTYKESDKLFNPTDFTIGFGKKILDNAYFGLNWKNNNTVNLGFLYRPFNFLSLGATSMFDDDFTELQSQRFGFAIRPFSSHKFTFGADWQKLGDDESIMPFIQTELIDGITLSASISDNNQFTDFDISEADINLNLGFNFGKFGIFESQTADAKGFGFTSSKQKYRTILGHTFGKKENYIRLHLDGLFIEEPEADKSKFNFNFDLPSIPFISSGPSAHGKQLHKFIEQLDELTSDETVDGLIIDLGYVQAGMGKKSEIHNAFMRFHEAGKKIIVYSKFGLGNMDVYLLSMADEIYIHEQAGVDLKGLNIEITFYKGLLDTLNIVPEVWRISPYKTAGDTFLESEMSSAMQENYGEVFGGLYNQFVQGIAGGKGWDIEFTKDIIDQGPFENAEHAKENHLITDTMYPDQFEDYINDINNGEVCITKWENIDRSEDYVYEWKPITKPKIAVIYAVGGIITGKSTPSPSGSKNMGDETISEAIKQAREDKSIDAIVLRIDSGGGSALASDIMWREILKTTEEDTTNVKPLIASMSDVAASGGYYIACQADKIIAYPSTITGSIGVIGLQLNFSKLKEKYGITTDGIKFGANADFASSSRLKTDEENKQIQDSINDIYQKFIDRVIDGRPAFDENDTLEDIALGRIWTGTQGISNGLVDVTGGFNDAIDLAKAELGIVGEVEIVEYPKYNKNGLGKMVKIGVSTTNLPKSITESLEALEIIKIIENDKVQMLIPYKITIK